MTRRSPDVYRRVRRKTGAIATKRAVAFALANGISVTRAAQSYNRLRKRVAAFLVPDEVCLAG